MREESSPRCKGLIKGPQRVIDLNPSVGFYLEARVTKHGRYVTTAQVDKLGTTNAANGQSY